MRVSKEEMAHFGELGNDSAELEHGGYLGSFRIFHELHCMVRPFPFPSIDKFSLAVLLTRTSPQQDWIKRGYSDLNATFPGNYRAEHFDHCLNIIRQGVQCRGDTTTSSWYAEPDNLGKPLIQRNHAVHTCVDWKSVERYLEPRLLKWDALGVLEQVKRPERLGGGLVPMADWGTYLKPT